MRIPDRPQPPPDAHYEVRIEQVGIYIWDSFDFCDPGLLGYVYSQDLGFWNNTGVIQHPCLGYDRVTNSDFRQWRDQNHRGGDFIIYSDARTISCTPPDTIYF